MSDVKTQICNRALMLLEHATITNLTENTKGARACNLVFDDARDYALRLHKWNWAMKRASIAKDTAAPAWGFSFQYTLPSDSVRFIGLDTRRSNYVLEGRKILTDLASPINISYITKGNPIGDSDPHFQAILAVILAIFVGPHLSASATKIRELFGMVEAFKSDGQFTDAAENPGQTIDADHLHDAMDMTAWDGEDS